MAESAIRPTNGAFNVPADVAVAVTNKPGGFYRAPDVAPDIATPAPRTVDFLAPSANTVFDVGAIGFRKYTAEADAIVYGVAHEHCSMMLSNGCVPLPPVGWMTRARTRSRTCTAQTSRRLPSHCSAGAGHPSRESQFERPGLQTAARSPV